MIGLLTTKELDFLTKLAELLKEYSAIISYGHCSELRILVCAGDSEDVEKYPIIFEDSFDAVSYTHLDVYKRQEIVLLIISVRVSFA